MKLDQFFFSFSLPSSFLRTSGFFSVGFQYDFFWAKFDDCYISSKKTTISLRAHLKRKNVLMERENRHTETSKANKTHSNNKNRNRLVFIW